MSTHCQKEERMRKLSWYGYFDAAEKYKSIKTVSNILNKYDSKFDHFDNTTSYSHIYYVPLVT